MPNFRKPLNRGKFTLDLERRATDNAYSGIVKTHTTWNGIKNPVSLPKLSCYGDEDVTYHNGRLLQGKAVIKERKS